jgi:hypothetical protein
MLEESFGFFVGPWNDVNGDQLADSTSRVRASLSRRLNGANVTADEYRHVSVEKIFPADENDIRSLYHGVRSLYSANQTARFNHSEGVHEVANLPESSPKSN